MSTPSSDSNSPAPSSSPSSSSPSELPTRTFSDEAPPLDVLNVLALNNNDGGDGGTQNDLKPIKWEYNKVTDSLTCGAISVTPAGIMRNGVLAFDTPPFTQLILGHTVGNGRFATVIKAMWRGDPAKRVMALKRYVQAEAGRVKSAGGVEYEIQMLLHPVRHPNVLQYFNMFCCKRTIYILMEYVNMGNLMTLVERYGPLSAELNVAISRQVLYGLQALHAHGYIHRDLKPSDILFNSNGSVKIGNFCIAKRCEGSVTQASTLFSNMDWFYRSPEQVLCQRQHGVKVDTYCFGLLITFAACGFFPLLSFEEIAAQLQTRQQEQQQNPTNPQAQPVLGNPVARTNPFHHEEANPDECRVINFGLFEQMRPEIDAPAQMQDVVHRCLSRIPTNRPSCAELLKHQLFRSGEQRTEDQYRTDTRAMVLQWFRRVGHAETTDFGAAEQRKEDLNAMLAAEGSKIVIS